MILSGLGSDWESVLEQHKYTGITAHELLRYAFSLSVEEWDDLKDRIDRTATHRSQEYLSLQEDFERYSETSAYDMPTPFADMTNMILDRHRNLSAHHVKILPCACDEHNYTDAPFYGTRLPYAAIIPEKDSDEDITMETLCWHHILLVVQFQRSQGLGGKRDREDEEADTEVPTKLQRMDDATARCCCVSTRPTSPDHPYGSNVSEEEVELAGHIAQVMSALSDRTFALGAMISGSWIQLTYYSRTAYVVARPFDLVRDPVTFSLLILLLSRQPMESLGFNEDMGYCNPFNTKGPPENTMQRYMTVHVTCQNHVGYMTFNISDMHFDMSEHFEHVVCHDSTCNLPCSTTNEDVFAP